MLLRVLAHQGDHCSHALNFRALSERRPTELCSSVASSAMGALNLFSLLAGRKCQASRSHVVPLSL